MAGHRGWANFVEFFSFRDQWARLALTEPDFFALQAELRRNPLGVGAIAGTGGLRKIRLASPGSEKGKSGSFRVFYFYYPDQGWVFLVGVIGKGHKENLDKAERNAMRVVAERLDEQVKKGVIR